MGQLKINHLAVWVSIILVSVLGFLWYGPIFQDTWMELESLSMEDIEANSGNAGIWITNFISTILMVYTLAWLFTKLNVNSLIKGLFFGFVISFVFVLMSRMTNDMFALKPYGLTWIVGGHNLAAMTMTGLILGAWRKSA